MNLLGYTRVSTTEGIQILDHRLGDRRRRGELLPWTFDPGSN
ncbi:MAG: hypothetical protein OXC01_13540 [Immundisolibacterales bacterium]|nr:hypothetical protein [Immundisolibacterales bacterium]